MNSAPEGRVRWWAGERCKRLYRKYMGDNVPGAAASVSYYFLFAMFPLLLSVAALCAYLPLKMPADQFLNRIRPLLPAQAMAIIDEQLRDLISRQRPSLLTFGLLGSFWSASRGVDAVRNALNRALDVREARPLWKTEGVTWIITIAGALLVMLAGAALVAGSNGGSWIAGRFEVRSALWSAMSWLRWPVLGLAFMTATGLAYRFLPAVKVRFRFVAPGAAAGGLVWVLATWGFGRYVDAFGHYHLTYGSLGGVMILLSWLYLSAFVAVAGAELNAALAAGRGAP